jgi:hypothetical protein
LRGQIQMQIFCNKRAGPTKTEIRLGDLEEKVFGQTRR